MKREKFHPSIVTLCRETGAFFRVGPYITQPTNDQNEREREKKCRSRRFILIHNDPDCERGSGGFGDAEGCRLTL